MTSTQHGARRSGLLLRQMPLNVRIEILADTISRETTTAWRRRRAVASLVRLARVGDPDDPGAGLAIRILLYVAPIGDEDLNSQIMETRPPAGWTAQNSHDAMIRLRQICETHRPHQPHGRIAMALARRLIQAGWQPEDPQRLILIAMMDNLVRADRGLRDEISVTMTLLNSRFGDIPAPIHARLGVALIVTRTPLAAEWLAAARGGNGLVVHSIRQAIEHCGEQIMALAAALRFGVLKSEDLMARGTPLGPDNPVVRGLTAAATAHDRLAAAARIADLTAWMDEPKTAVHPEIQPYGPPPQDTRP